MSNIKLIKSLSVEDIIPVLTSVSEVDTLLGLQEAGQRLDEFEAARWCDNDRVLDNQELVKAAFKGAEDFLRSKVESEPEFLSSEQGARGVSALMSFVIEAAEKIEKFTPLFKTAPDLEELKGFARI